MRAELFKIKECPIGMLAIMPRPRAGDWLEDEIASWRSEGVHTVVSLLEESEIEELDLNNEQNICESTGLGFIRFSIPDRNVPESTSDLASVVTNIVAELKLGRGVAIHCRIGVGRSAMLAVCVLTVLGIPVESAWQYVSTARGMSVPDTPEQRDFVTEWVRKKGTKN